MTIFEVFYRLREEQESHSQICIPERKPKHRLYSEQGEMVRCELRFV